MSGVVQAIDQLNKLKAERDEARRWAVHFYRLYRATQIEQAVNDANAAYEAGIKGMAREAVQSSVAAFGVDMSKWTPSPSNEIVEKARAAGIPSGLYRHDSDTGKDEIIEYPTVASKGRKAKGAK